MPINTPGFNTHTHALTTSAKMFQDDLSPKRMSRGIWGLLELLILHSFLRKQERRERGKYGGESGIGSGCSWLFSGEISFTILLVAVAGAHSCAHAAHSDRRNRFVELPAHKSSHRLHSHDCHSTLMSLDTKGYFFFFFKSLFYPGAIKLTNGILTHSPQTM